MYSSRLLVSASKYLVSALLLASVCLILQAINPTKVNAAYNGARLIDNSLFLDAKSMSASQIQSFLSSKNSGIADRPFTMYCNAAGSQAKNAYLGLGAPCNKETSAAKIIYYASQVYGISPKVILSTLQKEQSLVTSPNPTRRQMKQAMGYACPTSGTCLDSSTFFYQIDNGAWVLRFHYERARGNNSWWYQTDSWVCGTEKEFYKPNLYPKQHVKFYDENGVHYRTHYLENAATSSMYCYTPHAYNNPDGLYGHPKYGTKGLYYSGSYNFVLWYERWFGSTRANAGIRLIECDGKKFLVERFIQRKRAVSNAAVDEWGFDYSYAPEGDKGCSYSTYTAQLDRIMRSRKTRKLYLVDNTKAYWIPNQSIASAWGIDNIHNDYPMFDSDNINANLSVAPPYIPRLVTSDNPDRNDYYLIDGGKRYTVAGSPTGGDASIRLIKGYNQIPRATISKEFLSNDIPLAGTIDYSFKVGSTWYILDHNKVKRVSPSTNTIWDDVLVGPALTSTVLSMFSDTTAIQNGFERDGTYYKLTSDKKLAKTASPEIAANWINTSSPRITRLLTGKLLADTTITKTEHYLAGNIRLITCGGNKYLVERFIPTKRSITADGLEGWGFDDKYFFVNDRGCNYRTYNETANKLIRSRRTKKVYYVENKKAYYVHSQSIADDWDFGDIDTGVFPQFEPKSIHDNLEVVRRLHQPPQ